MKPRTCSACGQQAKPHAQFCLCGQRLPSTYTNRHPRTKRGQRRCDAQDRMLAGMRGPACVCGLRGPHECTRTEEAIGDRLAFLSNRQR
jgi:hypothetical protein